MQPLQVGLGDMSPVCDFHGQECYSATKIAELSSMKASDNIHVIGRYI